MPLRYIQRGFHTWPALPSLDRMWSRLHDKIGAQVGTRTD